MPERLTGFGGLTPPSSTPGSYRPPVNPPAVPSQSLPGYRYYTVTGGETLRGLAEALYGNRLEAQRIWNANRYGRLRDDRVEGFLRNMEETLTPGMVLLIP